MLVLSSYPQVTHRNQGESQAVGDYGRGRLVNGYLLPRRGPNFRCYSWLSYYVLGREYVHSRVYHTVLDAYQEMARQYPQRQFVYMETGRKRGGRPWPHRTHQIGLSVDFMSPLRTAGGAPKYYEGLGFARYLLNFDGQGRARLNREVSIDFDVLAAHVLVLDRQARRHGLRVSKVIFNTGLKDELFATKSGQKLKAAGIYFAQQLTPTLNRLHDDHYHVDFAPLP
ncbi:penicillin-insensitive murein endopeptidase [Hymenobacter gummosus]|uniref:penicillin-insensitive murein endopeptidase n=1 Tax=Hymenobacter gummosus TaxID=1776032 RepID=UPI001405128E|nr:penicillin-insensitive murein endopeptidase [Hymenobacter gummosus]